MYTNVYKIVYMNIFIEHVHAHYIGHVIVLYFYTTFSVLHEFKIFIFYCYCVLEHVHEKE